MSVVENLKAHGLFVIAGCFTNGKIDRSHPPHIEAFVMFLVNARGWSRENALALLDLDAVPEGGDRPSTIESPVDALESCADDAGGDAPAIERPIEEASLLVDAGAIEGKRGQSGHAEGECDGCVSCFCGVAPSVDEDGLCLGCGGTPVAIVEHLRGVMPMHPAPDLDADEAAKVRALIGDAANARAPQPPPVEALPDEDDAPESEKPRRPAPKKPGRRAAAEKPAPAPAKKTLDDADAAGPRRAAPKTSHPFNPFPVQHAPRAPEGPKKDRITIGGVSMSTATPAVLRAPLPLKPPSRPVFGDPNL